MTDETQDLSNLLPVLVTTAHRGVFFGYADPRLDYLDIGHIALKRARNAVYWPAETKGFLGLAVTGPTDKARIGPAADIILSDVTCVASVTPEAVAAWESAPWSR